MPERILDLYVEFRNHTNGLPTISGSGLLGALTHYGLDSIGAGEKDEMRELVLRGGPWSGEERLAILRLLRKRCRIVGTIAAGYVGKD